MDSIADDWKFRRVIPCHFAGPVSATPRDFREAFAWLEAESAEFASGGVEKTPRGQKTAWLPLPFLGPRGLQRGEFFRYREADLKLLNGLNGILLRLGVFKPTRP